MMLMVLNFEKNKMDDADGAVVGAREFRKMLLLLLLLPKALLLLLMK